MNALTSVGLVTVGLAISSLAHAASSTGPEQGAALPPDTATQQDVLTLQRVQAGCLDAANSRKNCAFGARPRNGPAVRWGGPGAQGSKLQQKTRSTLNSASGSQERASSAIGHVQRTKNDVLRKID
jgi:hypothetical protein